MPLSTLSPLVSGDFYAPRLDNGEALQREARHFVECVEKKVRPETDGPAGLRMVKMIEAAERSLRKRGELMELHL